MRCKQDSSRQVLAQVLRQKRMQGCRAAAQVVQAHACNVGKCTNEGVDAFMGPAISDLKRKHVWAVTIFSVAYIPGAYFNLALNASEKAKIQHKGADMSAEKRLHGRPVPDLLQREGLQRLPDQVSCWAGLSGHLQAQSGAAQRCLG